MKSWQTIKRIDTLGLGFFRRSHENTPYAWADVFFGPHKDIVHLIDKRSLEIVKTLRPTPGKTAAHVEFTRDGRYAACEHLGYRWRNRRIRRRNPRRNQTHPDEKDLWKVQRVQQDHAFRWYQSLTIEL
jgi:hypothetical protein